jgi:DNA repair exonuclease SbcCD ATPase subunit
MNNLKEGFLELLDKDKEFRYTVAGYLGLSEILKRLDKLEEGQKGLLEGQNRLWEEVRALREGQEKLWENQNKLLENQNTLWEEVKSLREGQNKLWEEVRDLRVTQNRLATTLDRLTISVEEEALDVIRHRLKNELGLDVELRRVFVDEREINVYGALVDTCVIGEATVRLGTGLIQELEEKIEALKRMRPELIKPRIIKVIYTDYAPPSALELAKEHDVWVLNWKGDLTARRIIQV